MTTTDTARTGRGTGRRGDGDPVHRGKILVAGIGNIFLSDDGFGVEVTARLAARSRPAGVKVADFGIRSLHLAYELLDGYDVLVLVDAMPVGEAAGTVVLVEAEIPDAASGVDAESGAPAVDGHTMSPAVVLANVANLGGSLDRVLVVGCQPATVADGIGLSDAVAASVDQAVTMVEDLLTELLAAPEPSHAMPEGKYEP